MKLSVYVLLGPIVFFGGCMLLTKVDRDLIPTEDATGGSNAGGTTNVAGSGGTASGGHAGQGGNVGGNTGGTTGTGGDAGHAGQGGSAGSAGQGGTAGGGGEGGSPPCEVGKYATINSVGGTGTLSSGAGTVAMVTFLIHGTSTGDGLDSPIIFVNNTESPVNPANPESTTALEDVIIRCQDPSGINSYLDSCYLNMTNITDDGYDSCTPGCYSASSSTIKMQILIDPASGQSGAVRMIAGAGLKVCDDQTQIPVRNIQ